MRSTRTMTGLATALGLLLAVATLVVGSAGTAAAAPSAPSAGGPVALETTPSDRHATKSSADLAAKTRGRLLGKVLPTFGVGRRGGVIVSVIIFIAVVTLRVVQHLRGRSDRF